MIDKFKAELFKQFNIPNSAWDEIDVSGDNGEILVKFPLFKVLCKDGQLVLCNIGQAELNHASGAAEILIRLYAERIFYEQNLRKCEHEYCVLDRQLRLAEHEITTLKQAK